jgi:hypothetical protein
MPAKHEVMVDDVRVLLSAPQGLPEERYAAATRVLLRGGFTPRLRELVKRLVREYPELRQVRVTVAR